MRCKLWASKKVVLSFFTFLKFFFSIVINILAHLNSQFLVSDNENFVASTYTEK